MLPGKNSAAASAIQPVPGRVPQRSLTGCIGKSPGTLELFFGSISQQVPERGPGVGFPWIPCRTRAGPGAPGELKVFAEISGSLFLDRVGAPFAALVGGCPVVVLAVETDPEVRAAGIAGVGPAGRPGDGPVATAGVAVKSHRKGRGRRDILLKKQKGINLAVDPLVMGPQYALTRALRSATEPTEGVSTALSQARPLCQPLVDTKNHQKPSSVDRTSPPQSHWTFRRFRTVAAWICSPGFTSNCSGLNSFKPNVPTRKELPFVSVTNSRGA